MEADTANRYRSRILREMNANRDNPFNSPPSSTGSHGTVSPTLSSVFSDPDGESTRRLNEDIARVTAPRKLPVNWEAAHRKWPEFYGMPKSRSVPVFEDNTDTRPMSSESKENRPPGAAAAKYNDDSTQDAWQGSLRTRSEMQPRVDNESDVSSILDKPSGRRLSAQGYSKNAYHASPLAKVHTHGHSNSDQHDKRRSSLTDALNQLHRSSKSPKETDRRDFSPQMASAKSSLTAVPPSPESMESPAHNASHVRSFFMPDVSHLGDFVTGTLKFNGATKNGVPILVKNGKVYDRQERPSQATHAAVDGVEVPEDEEKIFVSMDMIREEIISLQDHYDKVQEYAANLQQQVESLESQIRHKSPSGGRHGSDRANEQVREEKNRLEIEVASLQSRLEQASRKISVNEIENDSLTQEKDRAVRKLQEACDDINKLTRKLSVKEKELETSHKQMESTEQMRHDYDTLRRDIVSLKHGRDALEIENESLRTENETLQKQTKEFREESEMLRRQHESLISENRSLRSNNKTLMEENEDLRQNLDGVQKALDATHEEAESLRQEVETINEEKSTLREDNDSLVRHNEKYFNDNKILRRENSGFERSIHDLHDENLKLKEEVDFLKQQMDHCRPIPKEDFSARLDEETTGENMTSAFFIPDITVNTNETGPAENTETKGMPAPPDFTTQSNRLSTIADATEEQTEKSAKNDTTSQSKKSRGHERTKSTNKATSKGSAAGNVKVAFSIPETSARSSKSLSNLPNQGSKRRSTSQTAQNAVKKTSAPNFDTLTDGEDTTGFFSDNMTQDQAVPIADIVRSRKESKAEEQRRSRSQVVANQNQKSQGARSPSRSSYKRNAAVDVTSESYRTTEEDACPALSNDARRVLDGLCEHNCRNCTVCSRISSHRGVMSSTDLASGKKRVTVPRPVPVTDRDLSTEDPTMRPAHTPGHALAVVIKGLEDEAQHLQLELARMQSQYNGSDKALGRRERLSMAEGIRSLLKRLEAKNDQIYSLYDVLEGQKAAGQAMSEEEIEMTVLNITGMTVRDVTTGSEQMTWEGIPDL